MGRLKGLAWTAMWKLMSTPISAPSGASQEEAWLLLRKAIIMSRKQNAHKEEEGKKKRGIGIMRQKAQKQSEGNCGFCSKKQLLITCGHGFWATTKVWCLYLIHIPCRLLLLLLRFKNNYKFTVISTVHYEVQQWCAFLHSLVLLVFEWTKTKVLTLPWEVRGQVQLGGLQRDSQAQLNADKSWHLWERWAQSLCMKNSRCHHRVT